MENENLELLKKQSEQLGSIERLLTVSNSVLNLNGDYTITGFLMPYTNVTT